MHFGNTLGVSALQILLYITLHSLSNTLLHYITVSVLNDRVFMKAAGKVRQLHNEHTSQIDGP